MRQTIDKLAAKLVTLFTAAALFVALLLGGAGVPAQAAMPANDGKFYSDFLSYEESLAAGRDANAEIASEGITLLKNENDVLPLKDVKCVSVFGKNGVDPYYHGFGAGAAQSTLDPVTLYDGLEMAGYKTNGVLKAFYENDARSGSDRTIGELIGEAPAIITSQYWSMGWFETIGNVPLTEEDRNLDCGYFKSDFRGSSGSFYTVEGKMPDHFPKYFSIYGITTLSGIYDDFRIESIIDPSMLTME